MEPIFKLSNVSYTYLRQFEALKDVNLTIQAGELVSIMGANGSGKSTLLAILNALSYPSSGEFYAFGTLVREEIFDSLEDNEFSRFFRKKVGFLFQNPDVQLFSSTVFDEIAFGPLQLDMPQEEVKQRIEDVIGMLGIEEGLHRIDPRHESRCSPARRTYRRARSPQPGVARRSDPGTCQSRKDDHHRYP